jgi:hypothetical protein
MPRIQAFSFSVVLIRQNIVSLSHSHKKSQQMTDQQIFLTAPKHELNFHDGVASYETLQSQTHDAEHTSAMLLNNPRLSYTRL